MRTHDGRIKSKELLCAYYVKYLDNFWTKIMEVYTELEQVPGGARIPPAGAIS